MLASASPRRKELLAQIGLEPEIRPSRMEEETREKKPDMVVMELSRQKAEDVASGCPVGTMVIGADILADTPGQNHIQVSPHVVNGLHLIHVQADHSALAPVQLYKTFLA